MHTVIPLSPDGFADRLDGLSLLLAETVAGGASVGFRLPFDRRAAARWWRDRAPAVADGGLLVWVAEGPAGVMGTVSLALGGKANGRHRAEVVKLMVRPDARGRGLARTLLATAERAAALAGITLLTLDTETGSAADRLYRAAGWTPYGLVPGYATDPFGTLQDCTFFYKRIS